MEDFPEMSLTPLDEGSAALHELYTSYLRHGFQRGEALLLIAYLIHLDSQEISNDV